MKPWWTQTADIRRMRRTDKQTEQCRLKSGLTKDKWGREEKRG